MQVTPQKSFKTSDIFLASTLIALGFEVEKLCREESTKVEFSFLQATALEEAINKYWAKRLMVEPQTLLLSLKMLKNRIYSN